MRGAHGSGYSPEHLLLLADFIFTKFLHPMSLSITQICIPKGNFSILEHSYIWWTQIACTIASVGGILGTREPQSLNSQSQQFTWRQWPQAPLLPLVYSFLTSEKWTKWWVIPSTMPGTKVSLQLMSVFKLLNYCYCNKWTDVPIKMAFGCSRNDSS